mmetsp:Transcript_111875/g.266863  ORF Transcript_111875/g.266863 Transcript_111875/m.266863 type:complete len:244 (-) Transcript_111875:1759-2490(-)
MPLFRGDALRHRAEQLAVPAEARAGGQHEQEEAAHRHPHRPEEGQRHLRDGRLRAAHVQLGPGRHVLLQGHEGEPEQRGDGHRSDEAAGRRLCEPGQGFSGPSGRHRLSHRRGRRKDLDNEGRGVCAGPGWGLHLHVDAFYGAEAWTKRRGLLDPAAHARHYLVDHVLPPGQCAAPGGDRQYGRWSAGGRPRLRVLQPVCAREVRRHRRAVAGGHGIFVAHLESHLLPAGALHGSLHLQGSGL